MEILSPRMLESTSTPVTIAESPTTMIVLDVAGMKCAGCVSAVEKQLLAQSGVTSACVNLLTGVAAIAVQPETCTGTDLAAKLTSSGFPAQPRDVGDAEDRSKRLAQRQEKYDRESKQLLWQLVTAAILLVLSAVGHFTQPTTHLHHGDYAVLKIGRAHV